jgi:hypothetical protein
VPPVVGRPRRAARFTSAALAALVVAGCSSTDRLPAASQEVAGRTALAPPATVTPDATAGAQPSSNGDPVVGPSPTTEPAIATEIVPGQADRSSPDMLARYHVNAAITVATGALDVTTAIELRNESGGPIDRLELNTIAARLGRLQIVATTVDDAPVAPTVDDQTIVVPLGGILPDGATTTVRIEYRATLRPGISGSDWMFTRSGGTLAMYRWIPWISVAMPFDRPNDGQPFLTPSSPEVDVELLTDAPMVLAGPSAQSDEFAAGAGTAWSFSMQDVRDVAIVLAPEFRVAHGEADGVPVRAFSRPGGPSATQLLDFATGAVRAEADQLGMAFPLEAMTVVDTPGGTGLESPGLVWVPRGLDTLNRRYAVYQGVAHQWFYGLVGSDQRAEPFADEAPADLLARTALGSLRPSRCSPARLDRQLGAYPKSCYYEVIFVQGGRLLDDIRRRMGSSAFWAALRAYLTAYRNDIGGTRQLFDALRDGTSTDLLPLIRSRFPSLY